MNPAAPRRALFAGLAAVGGVGVVAGAAGPATADPGVSTPVPVGELRNGDVIVGPGGAVVRIVGTRAAPGGRNILYTDPYSRDEVVMTQPDGKPFPATQTFLVLLRRIPGTAIAPTAAPVTAAPGGPETSTSVDVISAGATGDGETDDTEAFNAAISAAGGGTIIVPSGVYILDGVQVPEGAEAHFELDADAVLRHKPAAAAVAMIAFAGDRLTIRGGQMDGSWQVQTNRERHLIQGHVESGRLLGVYDVRVRNSLKSVVDIDDFGGTLEIVGCEFTGQAEHTGVKGEHTMIARVGNGQEGGKGLVRFNHNRAYGTVSPAIAGGSPGGIFLCVNGYVAGAPGSDGFSVGNRSSVEAIGNYFYGYGQHPKNSNDISPIHTYPHWSSVRVIGNHFEGCGYSAISAKSAEEVVIIGNTVTNGQVNVGNTNVEGAIDVVLGYQGGSSARRNGVVSGNVVRNPGGESDTERQTGITVRGLAAALAEDVIVTGNVVSECGQGVKIMNARNVTVVDNIIRAGTTSTVRWDRGARLDFVSGLIVFRGNHIVTSRGEGIATFSDCTALDLVIESNTFEHSAPGAYACAVKGVRSLRMHGNMITVAGATPRALYVGADTAGNKTQLVAMSRTNVFRGSGTVTLAWADIVAATGDLTGPVSPEGLVSAPGGSSYTQINSDGRSVLWFKGQGSLSSGWVALTTTGGTPAG